MSDIDRFSVGKEFHLKEYEFLRKEIAELVEHTRKLEIYAVGAIAAFYAWFIKEQPPTPTLFIPTALALLGGFRSYAALIRIYEISDYLRIIERSIAWNESGLCGWESYRKNEPDRASTRFWIYTAPFLSSAAIFWIALALMSIMPWCLGRNSSFHA